MSTVFTLWNRKLAIICEEKRVFFSDMGRVAGLQIPAEAKSLSLRANDPCRQVNEYDISSRHDEDYNMDVDG